MKLKKPKFWDQKSPNYLAVMLWPLSIIFMFATYLKFKKKIKYKNIKTICLGNIYVGGTGKTSLAIKFKKILDNQNIKSCFIKKDYSKQIDEQKLLSNYGKLFIDKSRSQALKKAILEKYDFAIFDDGLQDESIVYDIKFVCFNNINWIGNSLLIPAGPLRESKKCLQKYKNVFLNGNNENLDNIKNEIKKINPSLNIFESKYIPTNLEEFDIKKNYLVFSGIGNHKTFIDMLKINNFNILKDLEYPDHYNYSYTDLNDIINLSKKLNAKIVTTEKDFLRIDSSMTNDIKYIKSELQINNEDNIKKIFKNLNEQY